MNKPIQYVFVGLPFSGKTILAKELEKRLGYPRVNIDEIKFKHGFEGLSDDDVPGKEWEKIFNDLESRVVKFLKEGKSVLSETAWITRKWRDRARKVAKDAGFETKIIYVDTPNEVVIERWKKNKESKVRFDLPDNIFEEALRDFEVPTEDERIILYNQFLNLDEWIRNNFKDIQF